MANLIFFDADHTYTVDGQPVPSVSELTRFVSREVYGTVNQFTLDNAASRGTKIHKACEVLDKYGEVEISEDIAPYIQAYVKFRKEHTAKWDKIEFATHHPDNLYAGTVDRYGTLDGTPCIVDIKSSCAIQKPLYTAQLNLYRMMFPDKVEALYILHLTKDGKYKLVDIPIDDGVAMACLTLHKALEKKPRKKKTEEENARGEK